MTDRREVEKKIMKKFNCSRGDALMLIRIVESVDGANR